MDYFQRMLRILRFDEAVYREVIMQNKLSLAYTAINVAMFGLIYGFSATYFSQYILEPGDTDPLSFHIRLTLVLMGISVSFLIHGGMALFAWVFCRGFGGSTLFLPIYLALGMAWISFWPLAPALAALQVKLTGGLFFPIISAVLAFALTVVFHALKSASGLSQVRMLIVFAVIIVYICSFMYLWVG
ncbi:MAG: hypothetical protein KJ630_15100 [Proteobacteria bacterium]|nr:hypothetical protein [Pseudomonadota bacterium]